MKSPVVKRSIVVAGHKTSVSLEEAFCERHEGNLRACGTSRCPNWSAVKSYNNRQQGNLSSAIRLFVLDYFRSRAPRRPPLVRENQSQPVVERSDPQVLP